MSADALVLHHLGIAARDLNRQRQFVERAFRVLGVIGPVFDANLKADLLLMEVEGAPAIELVSGPAVQHVLSRGVLLYHVCYEVDDLDRTLGRQRAAGAMVIVPPCPAVLFEHRRVAFVNGPIGLVEYLERAPGVVRP